MDDFQCHAVSTDCSRTEEGFGIGLEVVWSSESYFSIRLMVCLGGVGGYLFASQRCSAGG